MRLLLDTHSFLWYAEGDARLSPAARAAIEDPGNEIFLSVASVWEMAIKVSLGKLDLDRPFDEMLSELIQGSTVSVLEIALRHLAAVVDLPWHHRDPFDRMLVAQGQVEQMAIISADTALDAYSITRVW